MSDCVSVFVKMSQFTCASELLVTGITNSHGRMIKMKEKLKMYSFCFPFNGVFTVSVSDHQKGVMFFTFIKVVKRAHICSAYLGT